jgi:hypothetical protein
MQAHNQQPLSNTQLEILKVFSHELNEEDLQELKKLLADFFAQKAIQEANRVWDEEQWNESKVEELLSTKLRTPPTYRIPQSRNQKN